MFKKPKLENMKANFMEEESTSQIYDGSSSDSESSFENEVDTKQNLKKSFFSIIRYCIY